MSIEEFEKSTNIPFMKIIKLKKYDTVFTKHGECIEKGILWSIDYDNLTISILIGKTFSDYMMFHQYGRDRQSPFHCWTGAWALTKEELK